MQLAAEEKRRARINRIFPGFEVTGVSLKVLGSRMRCEAIRIFASRKCRCPAKIRNNRFRLLRESTLLENEGHQASRTTSPRTPGTMQLNPVLRPGCSCERGSL